MKVIQARNVNSALPLALNSLKVEGYDRDSRNGPVRMFPEPVTTVYRQPTERVIFYPERDANPFFHLFESLWMLNGQNDVKFPAMFAGNIRNYSDDGKTFHGAYGHRWRVHFGFDQLQEAINALKANPDDRRVVVQMWDSQVDLGRQGKDFPCNTQVIFSRDRDGRLDMIVCNRSNDIVWGCYGANAVHFSYLQEYVAAGIGCPVGVYRQMSNNLHAYHDILKQVESLSDIADDAVWRGSFTDPYTLGEVAPFALVSSDLKRWDEDLAMFMAEGPIVGLRDPFFRRVAIPMWVAWQAYKKTDSTERYDLALENLAQCRATDWRRAGEEWILRRRDKALGKGEQA